tara:strand:+ start:1398 stop:2753 length:1356 start_codon:yes stop_codon:yes gene_type:complete
MDLTQGNIKKQLISMAVPAGIGMFFYTMYNVVDTFYAGLISTEALAGLAISFPVYFILLAFAVGFGQGSTALVSNLLGAKKEEDAVYTYIQSLTISLIISIFIGYITYKISEPVFVFFGASGLFLESGLKYMHTLSFGAPFFIFANVINSFLYAKGDTKKNRNALIIGFFINLIFNPLLSLGIGPFPALGTMGIAIATIICQIFNVCYLGYYVLKAPLAKKFKISYCKLKLKSTKDIFKQSFPASMNMLLIGVGFFIIQKYVTGYGANASAGYGIALRIEQIILLPAIGLNTAMLSMTGQNYGAKNFDRIYDAFTTSLKLALFIMIFGSAILFTLGEKMAFLFTRDDQVIQIAGSYLFMAAFLTFVYQVIHQSGSVLSGMKKPTINAFYTLLRLAIIPPFTFYFFSQTLGLGLKGIWWAILCSNVIAAILIFLHMRYLIKKESFNLKKSSI